jgi:hypothetical protein
MGCDVGIARALTPFRARKEQGTPTAFVFGRSRGRGLFVAALAPSVGGGLRIPSDEDLHILGPDANCVAHAYVNKLAALTEVVDSERGHAQ